MEKGVYHIKGQVVDRRGQAIPNMKVKAYDDKGVFIVGSATDKKGSVHLECGSAPKTIKLVKDTRTIGIKDVADIGILGSVIDWGVWRMCLSRPPNGTSRALSRTR